MITISFKIIKLSSLRKAFTTENSSFTGDTKYKSTKYKAQRRPTICPYPSSNFRLRDFSFNILLIAIICICRFEEAKQDDGSATISQQDKPKRKSKTTSRLSSSSEESSLFLADEETTQPELGRSRRFKSSSKTVNRSGSGRSLNTEEDVDWADDDASSSSFNDDLTTEGAVSSGGSGGSRDGFGRSVSGFGGSGATRRRQAPGTSSRQPSSSSSNTNSNSNSRSSFSQRSKVRESLRESLDNRRSDGPKISLPPKGLTSGFTPRDRSSSSSSASRGFTPSSAADLEDIRPTASKKAASGSSSSSPFVNPEKKPKVEFKKFDRFERPDIRKNLLNKFLKNRPAGGESNDTMTMNPASAAATTAAGSNEDGGEEDEGLDDNELFFDDHESSSSALVPSIINDEDLLQHLGERPIKLKLITHKIIKTKNGKQR